MFRRQVLLCQRQLFRRTFATEAVVPHSSADVTPPSPPIRRPSQKNSEEAENQRPLRVPVKEDHGLYGFFERRLQPNLRGEDRFETLPPRGPWAGRAWRAAELRRKTFRELHTLWYVLLRERNVLATQRKEVGRLGIQLYSLSEVNHISRKKQVQNGLRAIKVVMNERRLAYLGAVELAESQRTQQLDAEILKHKTEQYEQQKQELKSRKEFLQGHIDLAQKNAAESAAAAEDTGATPSKLDNPEPTKL